jgi:hypothetical protein
LSGPLLDRIDMRITLRPMRAVDLVPATIRRRRPPWWPPG